MSYTSDLVKSVQTRLKELGYYTGMLDGESGPLTEMATSDFKRDVRLVPRPYPGPITLAYLFSPTAKPKAPAQTKGDDPAWLVEAKRHLGLKEVPGPGNNPTIMKWAADLDQWYPDDATAWCGLFVAHCMATGAPKEPQNFNRLGAREWLKYGEASDPCVGSVCVLWRDKKSGWQGHVFIATAMNDTHIRGIGGNQSDSVSEAWFSRDRLLGFRKPKGAKLAALPKAIPGEVSVREA